MLVYRFHDEKHARDFARTVKLRFNRMVEMRRVKLAEIQVSQWMPASGGPCLHLTKRELLQLESRVTRLALTFGGRQLDAYRKGM